MTTDFRPFPKMGRLSREVVITEKIDGTNASIYVGESGEFQVGSRTRWIVPGDDNFGFAAWAYERREELIHGLGPGHHFGEWWGQGIQRSYGLKERRFSLFNVHRWALYDTEPLEYPTQDPRVTKRQDVLPECCGLVPVLHRGLFDTMDVELVLAVLHDCGSKAAPGFMKPEGIVVFHTASGVSFKKTLEKDEQPKGLK